MTAKTAANEKSAKSSAATARFLIWSNEHMAWWKPNRCGYSSMLQEAGSYTEDEADEICAKTFRGTGQSRPDEVRVPDPRLATYGPAETPAHQALYEALRDAVETLEHCWSERRTQEEEPGWQVIDNARAALALADAAKEQK